MHAKDLFIAYVQLFGIVIWVVVAQGVERVRWEGWWFESRKCP